MDRLILLWDDHHYENLLGEEGFRGLMADLKEDVDQQRKRALLLAAPPKPIGERCALPAIQRCGAVNSLNHISAPGNSGRPNRLPDSGGQRAASEVDFPQSPCNSLV